MKIVDFVRPKTVEKACLLFQQLEEKAVIVAGGTAFRFLSDDSEKTAIDISALRMNGIKKDKDSFIIGAGTNISEILEFKSDGWVLNKVAKKFSNQQIRNISTIGGNIARIFPWSDFPVALLALGAKITINDGKERTFTAKDFFKHQPTTHLLKHKALITEIHVPALVTNNKQLTSSGFGYHKEVRTLTGFSTLTVSAYIKCESGTISEVSLAAGAALGLPIRLTKIENELKNKPAETLSFEKIVPSLIKDIPWKGKEGATNEYAEHLAKVVVLDVLNEALKFAKGGI